MEVSDGWLSGIGSCRQAGGERFEPVYVSFFLVKISLIAVKIKKMLQFTAFTAKR